MYAWQGRSSALATATYAASRRRASTAAIGELAIFMWNVAGAPPNRTGVQADELGHRDARQDIDGVEVVARPIVTRGDGRHQVTGTISIGDAGLGAVDDVLAGASLYRKLPVA